MRLPRWLRRMGYPDQFDGFLTLRYPPHSGGGPTPGWRGEFATDDGQLVNTVSRAVIYCDPEWPVWGELTMFTTTDGRPALDVPCDLAGIARKRNGDFRTRTFRYLIEFAQERPADGAAPRVTTGGNGRPGSGGGGAGGSHGPDVVFTVTGGGSLQ